ncbi:multiple inositol polyphosphate phosphatase 1-like [Macrosteles quadrilineatus]|uniref:multiple inositol polyphosphate phosphatase 1-like n=1 Tax=Macrosteles quadrilineatus TaxID=74068 RepID=UPI0023E281F5|nr:multiple inositol polyphosphate phosphatase 1-like [Macrosteles quadrilineatus]
MAKYWTTPTSICFLLLVFVSSVFSDGDGSCYSTDGNPYLYFGTKTTYDVVRNPLGIPKVPECKPLQVWMVARHGAHHSNSRKNSEYVNLMDLRDQILENHEQGRGSLCPEDLMRLREWREFKTSSQEQDSLTPQGVRDSYSLGLRVRQAFPDLFNDSEPSKDFVFRHTEQNKSKETTEYFIRGLFGIIYNPQFAHPQESKLLGAHDNCPAWTQKNAKYNDELDTFKSGELMNQVYITISRRLGFNYDLPFYVVDAMYQWCAGDKSSSLESSAVWCSAFTATELKAMEFLDDLEYYHKTGPGDRSNINKKLGCPFVKDMLTQFRVIEMNPDAKMPKGVFYFGDAEVVGLLASRLGIFADKNPPSATSYVDQGQRSFRSSALLPWGANIMAVFYQCSTEEAHRVMFLVSEYVVSLPGCPSGLCPWSLVHHRLSHSLERHGCSLEFCSRLSYQWISLAPEDVWAIVIVVATVLFIVHLFRCVNELTA